MIPSEPKTPIKMAGHLEKKSKMRVVSRWKKLWFVLEGRLLLYYKSQLEYLSLSPCRGTVNMGLAASVLPGNSHEIIISTRSHIVSLRALSKKDHDIWLQALIDAMCLQNSSQTRCCSKPHYRYSDENPYENPYGTRQSSTLPMLSPPRSDSYEKYGRIRIKSSSSLQTDSSLSQRSETNLKRSSKVAMSETSIPGRFKLSSDYGKAMKRSYSVDEEFNRCDENIYESLKSDDLNKKVQMKKSHRLNRSDSDCLSMSPRERLLKNMAQQRRKEMKPFGKGEPWTLAGNINDVGKRIRSDTDLPSLPKREYDDRYLSSSCDFANLRELIKEKINAPIPLPRTLNQRSNSFLRHFSPKRKTGRKISVKKRLSFLKRIWCRRESSKWEPNPVPIRNPYQHEMEGPDSDLEIMTDASDDVLNYESPRPEPPPDYDDFNVSDEEIKRINRQMPNVPPRYSKGARPKNCSPWHDVPLKKTEKSENSWSLEAPELPPKTSSCINNAKDLLSQDTDNGIARLFEEMPKIVSAIRKDDVVPIPRKKDELTEMLEYLAALNKPIFTTSLYQNTLDIYEEAKRLRNKQIKEEPDYDVPRPHASLLASLKQRQHPSTMQPTKFLTGHFEDSLDLIREGNDVVMAPDSLECEPWNESIELLDHRWIYHHPRPQFDSIYQDSLNVPEYVHSNYNLRIS